MRPPHDVPLLTPPHHASTDNVLLTTPPSRRPRHHAPPSRRPPQDTPLTTSPSRRPPHTTAPLGSLTFNPPGFLFDLCFPSKLSRLWNKRVAEQRKASGMGCFADATHHVFPALRGLFVPILPPLDSGHAWLHCLLVCIETCGTEAAGRRWWGPSQRPQFRPLRPQERMWHKEANHAVLLGAVTGKTDVP
eukprot:XP_016876391.1 uncharacterized protein LOC105370362 isoform X2 [Homo sapiens]